ncbi:hypothetical protein ACFQU1_05560 [Chelatococcus sp. GCM10030263]|uniref:hypothetical protein n=1 Tax=Chelatococcus sp. GCM10030263 TaxID=3273387 RepID=UPI00360F975C
MPTSNANLLQASETFEAIAAAISETARGRWFLAEYVRRQRNSELQALIDALGRLQGTNGSGQAPAADLDRLRFRLVQMQRLIERAKIEIALAPGSRPLFDQPANENALDSLIHEQEKTTAAVIDAAEFIQEMVWSERGEAAGKAVSERLASLYASAASSMALTERFRLVARLIDQLQQRLAKTVEACDAPGHATVPPEASEAEANLPLAVRLVVNNGGLSAQTQAQAPIEVQAQAPSVEATRPPESRAEMPAGTRTASSPVTAEPDKPKLSANDVLARLSALTTAEKLRRFT